MFNGMGLFLFLVTAVTFFVFGMVIMAVCAANSRYEDKTDAYNIGYAKGVEAEQERISNLIDKLIADGKKDGENTKE